MPSELSPVVFLDRDGVLNRMIVRGDVTHPPDDITSFEFLPGVLEATTRLHTAGFRLVVVTNQPDVARGRQSRERVEAMNDLVRRTLPILDVLTCYHDNADDCLCRKPKPGLLLEAAHRFALDPRCGFMVGDRWSDVLAGQAAGCQASVLIALPTSGREKCTPDYCAVDLTDAVEWILTSRP